MVKRLLRVVSSRWIHSHNSMRRKQSFYSPRKFVLTVVGATLLLISVNGVGLWLAQEKKKQAQSEAQTAQAKLTPKEVSIQKTFEYLTHNISQFSDSEKLFIHYLHRRFNLEVHLPKDKIGSIQRNLQSPQEIDFMYRIVDPNDIVVQPFSKELVDANKITRINLYSSNCDVKKLPSDFWPSMKAQADKGGFEMTHVALALVFIRDNECSHPPEFESIKDQVLLGMRDLAMDPATMADLRYEAIAFLYLHGREDLVQEQWIDSIIKDQLPEGGWAERVGDKKPLSHTTTLALWCLLESSNPDKPYEPLIRRPG